MSSPAAAAAQARRALKQMARSSGRFDAGRYLRGDVDLGLYLRQNGVAIPRTTVRDAIEGLPPAKRRVTLELTARLRRNQRGTPRRSTHR